MKSNSEGQIFVCKDYYLLFFSEEKEAETYALKYMGEDFFMTQNEADFELGDYGFFSIFNGKSTSGIYKPLDIILFLKAKNLIQTLYRQEVVICHVILGEKVGWIPLHSGSFEKYFTRAVGK